MLAIYQQILQCQEVTAGDAPEQIYLRLSGLVVEQQGNLKVYNPIYEAIFNRNWVEQEQRNLRPDFYATIFEAWLNSGHDSANLLRGESLNKALIWAEGRSLSNLDYQFISASQQLVFAEAQRKTRRQIGIGATLLALSIAGVVAAVIAAGRSVKEAQVAQEGIRLEQQGVLALNQFEQQNQQLDALVLAMEAGQSLKALVKDGQPLEKYPATRPILALQTILDNIHERAQLKVEGVGSVKFSPDGQRILTTPYIYGENTGNTAKLWDIKGNLLADLKGHQAKLNSAKFSPDGQRILTASDDNTAKLWDTQGNLLTDLTGHQDKLKSAEFSPDGQRILTTSDDKTAKLWNMKGNLLANFQGYKELYSAKFSPDGQHILTNVKTNVKLQPQRSAGKVFITAKQRVRTASSDNENVAKLWDIEGNLLAELKGNQDELISAQFSPDGQSILITSDDNNTVKLWDTKGNLLADFKEHQEELNSAKFSPDGQRILTTSRYKTSKLWDTKGNLLADLTSSDQPNEFVVNTEFSPDGQRIITTSQGRNNAVTAKVWDIKGNPLFDLDITGNLSHPFVSTSQNPAYMATFSPNGQYIVTASGDSTVQVWDNEGKEVKLLADLKGGHYPSEGNFAFSPDGQHIVIVSHYYNSIAKVWDIKGHVLEFDQGGQFAFFSPDGQFLLTDGNDNTAKIWNIKANSLDDFKGNLGIRVEFSPDSQRILTIDGNTAKVLDTEGNLLANFKGHQDNLNSAEFSPDGQRILTASDDNTTKLWDTEGNLLVDIKGHQGKVNSAEFSPDGQRILTASDDNTAKLWDAKGNLLADINKVNTAVFSPDGQRILTASDDNTTKLWDTKGNLLVDLKKHLNGVKSAAFSPDGQRIVTASYDKTAKVWDIKGNLLADLKGHIGSVNIAKFSPDGQRILTATQTDTFVKVWDIKGNLLADLEADYSYINSAAFSPDGQRIVITSGEHSDYNTKVWQVEGLDELLKRGCDWLQDYFVTNPEARERLWICQTRS